ncbi:MULTISPECIES: UDP-glucose 4-epimerase family protein [Paraburkholderia]|uniref:UDP-glucose 4-epimerase family protein n=1 Tax=Paraburkholderia TaxID=1822464 RepID=UPI0003658A44|nr:MULTISPECIES: SDR family oxidoreductase [Paraburkholderia]MDH6148862.1 nucleoside-diphosphate-sugar epimerase [Paraburkholderia sp. WSM4179]
MSRVLVTGASGFVGRSLCRALTAEGHAVTALVRQPGCCTVGVREWVHDSENFKDVSAAWPQDLRPDCVVHLAARVHVMRDSAADPDAAFRQMNVGGTMRVAGAAQRHGARRFVFVSSVKAQAEIDPGRPLREDDPPCPQDAYGRSKAEAEQSLTRYGAETGIEIVVVRPPLVYGAEVRANFLRLMDAIAKGVPLPLGVIAARRSMVYVENLADALKHCVTDPRAAGGCFNVADDTSLTVAELARTLGRHLGKPARLVPVPASWLHAAGRLTGRQAQVERLIGSLRQDTSHIRDELGWQPPYSTDDGLAATARWYRSTH